MEKGISASLMCTDFTDTRKSLGELVDAKIEYLHFDIMDGVFVPNYTLGVCLIDQLRGQIEIPFDIHLMVDKPENKIPYFHFAEGDFVSVHAESTVHLQRVLATLKSQGIRPGVALNPATPIDCLEYVADVVDYVLIMTVNPGYAGQKMVETTLKKITEARAYLDSLGRQDAAIQVDGNVSFENARRMSEAGAVNFVAGTAGLFRRDMTIKEAADRLRKSIGCTVKESA